MRLANIYARARGDLDFDYTTIGHVTADVLPDGSRRAGGSAFYSALQASRLGLRACVLTQGVPAEVEELIAPYRDELHVDVRRARQTTTMLTRGAGTARQQRVLAWAGEMEEALLDTAILHVAPVARESPARWRGSAGFVGLTPQGLLRDWHGADGVVSLGAPSPAQEALAERCDALVLSEQEHAHCELMIERARRAGALVAITAGAGRKRLLLADGVELRSPVEPVSEARDDLGAGDVFAAALFVAMQEGRRVPEAARFAAAAAALRVEGLGAAAIAGRAAVEERLRGEQAPPGRLGAR